MKTKGATMTRRSIIGFAIGWALAILFDLAITGINCGINHQPRTCWMGMPIEAALKLSRERKP